MTDDFHLFADPDDGETPIDPDLALMSAYLARELSPMQVLALEERLATDATFRAAMQPLIDLWAAPVASLESGAARRVRPLSTEEKTESWRRFVEEELTTRPIGQNTYRRVSMKRVAAVIGLVILPMVSFAQVVVHAANNADAPGHTIARRIVAPFVDVAPAPKPRAQTPRRAGSAPLPRPSSQPEVSAVVPLVPNDHIALEALTATPNQRAEPNRARIAELARQHQPAVVGGDTAAEYIVMVVDASDQYVWSTFGSGNLSIEIAGDPRTPAERIAYNREHRAEFRGTDLVAGVAREIGSVRLTRAGSDSAVGGFFARTPGNAARGGGGGRGGVIDSARSDTSRRGRVIRGTVAGVHVTRVDSFYRLRLDTIGSARGGRGGARGGGSGVVDSTAGVLRIVTTRPGDAAGGSGGGRGGAGVDSRYSASAQPGPYRNGWSATRNGPLSNQASGLTEAGDGQSGIQGLPSASVSSADTYVFGPGELAAEALKIMVVRLVPGSGWNGR